MSKINGGATIWARQTIESEIFYWKPDKWFKIWFYIVNKVNHKDNNLFERGSNFMTYKEIELATKATKNQIDSFLRFAKAATPHPMLTTRKTTRGMVVEVTKYAYYQCLGNYKNTKTDTKTETKPKHNRNTTDTINKNVKNDKNVKNTTGEKADPVVLTKIEQRALGFLKGWNKIHGTKYRAYKPITDNLEYWLESYSSQEIGQAVMNVRIDPYWKNKNMAPSTFLRQRNPNREKVDYIGRFLHSGKEANQQSKNNKNIS